MMAHTRVSDAKQVETLDAEQVAEKLGGTVEPPEQPSTALATTDGAAGLVVASDWAELASEFDDGSRAFREHFGLTMPRLKSDFGRNGRGWVDDLTDEAVTALRIVILAQPPSRTFWLKDIDDGGGGGRPDCKSTNLLSDRPDDNVPEPQSARCSTCPHSQWGEKEDGSPIKPKCSEAVNVLAYDLDGERFVWVAFKGMSIKPFRKYVSALYSRNLAVFGVQTVITTEKIKDGALDWLEARFALGEPLAVEYVRPLREVAKAAMATWQTDAEAMAASDAKSDAGPFDEPKASTPDDQGEF